MSVIASKRSESSVQYVTTARDLLKFTTQKCLKLPKRLTFFISTDLVKTTQDIYKIVLHIKTLYKTDKIEKKIELCEKVMSLLNYVYSMIDIIKVYAPNFSVSAFERWIELVNKETALIKGVVKKLK